MAREFRTVDLLQLLPALSTPVLIMTTVSLPSHRALYSIPAGRGNESLAIEHMPDISAWIENTTTVGALPVSAMQRIVQWLERCHEYIH
jgi:hypothetical protein